MKCDAGYHARWNYQLQRFIELQYVLLKQLRAQSIDTGQQNHRAAHRDDTMTQIWHSVHLDNYANIQASVVHLVNI